MRRVLILCVILSVLALPSAASGTSTAVTLSEFRLSDATMAQLQDDWYDQILAKHAPGTWAPLKMELSDRHLALMGLPPAHVLRAMDFSRPTAFHADGSTETFDPALVSFAGAGYFGIRPGAWILLINDGGIGWCSAAHVYGSPGAYDISTAGHCGKTGDIATVIGVVGNNTPVLIDFGKFSHSTDGGVGKDWGMIDIYAQYQHLVTPTMAFWGGPRGMYTKTGAVAGITFSQNNLLRPQITLTPDPLLAQQIAHYGHGTGIGAGGTPRTGTALAWGSTHFMFFGALAPGDSGSGSNTITGDTVGATMEAAGINTHIYVDPLMRKGLGIMAGTRSTAVSGTLANGQLVGYPVPIQILP